MNDQSELRSVRLATERFFSWLTNDSLPLWSTTGVDWANGGFVEQLTIDGKINADVRRARLVARQIFAFKSAGDLGWTGKVDRLVEHGLSALLENHVSADGRVIPRFIPLHGKGDGEFDLYDQAFALFGLAHGYASTRDLRLEPIALSILAKMREGFSHEGGFAEHRPAQAPLKANPHMHLLEAALAWTETSENETWRTLAAELVRLCLSRFIAPQNGSLHEFFDTDWSILEGTADVVEPGHQAEWAWLLLRAQRLHVELRADSIAERLVEIAENCGLNRQQHRLINELNPDLSERDTRLRLWPQTERIKALITLYKRETSPDRRRVLSDKLADAISSLLGYFEHPIAGSWWEHFDDAGNPISEPARASSLYHVIGAANELSRLTNLSLS